MARGQYTSIGRGGHGGGGRGGHGGHHGGFRGGHHHGGRGWGWGGWGGWGGGWPWWGGWGGWGGWNWPYYGNYLLPAYDITDGGTVFSTGQVYSPSYGSYGLPVYGDGFPHWRSPRHFLHRHRRRVHYLLGQDLD